MDTLTVYDFFSHLRQEGFSVTVAKGRAATMNDATPVVIRGLDGDYGVAAVHFDEGWSEVMGKAYPQLVIDLGRKL